MLAAAIVRPTNEDGKPVWSTSNAVRQDALSAQQVMRVRHAVYPQAVLFRSLYSKTSLRNIFAEAFSENASLRLRQTILDALIDPYAAGPNVRLFEIPYEESIADDPEREIDRWISRICQATGTDIDALAFEYQKRVNALAKEIAWG